MFDVSKVLENQQIQGFYTVYRFEFSNLLNNRWFVVYFHHKLEKVIEMAMNEINYKKIIGLNGKNGKTTKKTADCYYDKSFPERLLDRATYYRDFEIKASWERSKYFILFLGALFVAYYTMKQSDPTIYQFIIQPGGFIKQIPIKTPSFPNWMFYLITGLGTIISFVWYWVNRGSKLIYENWEHHIDFIEQEYEGLGKISRNHCWKTFKKCNVLEGFPISPSRANTMVSLCISISFLMLFCYETGLLYCVIKSFVLNCYFLKLLLLFGFFVFLFYLPVFIKSKSYPSDCDECSNNKIYVMNRLSKNKYSVAYNNPDEQPTWTKE